MAEIIIPQKAPKMETFEWLCVTILVLFFILLLICSAYIPFLSIIGFQSHFLVILPSYLLYILIYSLLLPCDHKRASENSSALEYYCTSPVLGILIVNAIEPHINLRNLLFEKFLLHPLTLNIENTFHLFQILSRATSTGVYTKIIYILSKGEYKLTIFSFKYL